MEHKPLHLITNITVNQLKTKCHEFHLEIELYTEDHHQTNNHIHAFIAWPINTTEGRKRITPSRTNWIRSIRRAYGCRFCKYPPNLYTGKQCPHCNLYLKFIWPHTPEHLENIKTYIKNKPIYYQHQGEDQYLQFRGHYTTRDEEAPIHTRGPH